jgi:hypothetical protein
MSTDQVESLTREKRDAQHIIDSLPVEENTIQSLIADDKSEEQNPLVGFALTGLTWIGFAVAIGAVALMTWAMITGT